MEKKVVFSVSLPPSTSRRRHHTLTLRDVSEASGVSEMTVSRVLRHSNDVSAGTRERVLEAARQLGYVPNKIAGALASQRVNLVGLVIPSLSNMVFPDVISGISEALSGTDLQPVIGVTNYLPEQEEAVIYQMLSWRPSALVIAGLEHTDASRAMLSRAGIPIVEIMDIDGTPIDSVVGISHRRAGREMAHAILQAGYRKIAFMGTQMTNDHRARKRLEGFSEVVAEAGLRLLEQEFYSGGSSLLKGKEMTDAVLSRRPDIDFLYYSNDMIGAGGLLYCLEKGIDVPRHLGLAGFNGVELLAGLPRRLATMNACRHEIGRAAAQIIIEQIFGDRAGKAKSTRTIALQPQIDLGETIRSP